MDEPRHLSRRVILALEGLALLCVLGAALAALLRPRHFTTFRETIGYELEQRGIAYEQIEVTHAWPETVNYLAYGARVEVRLPEGRRAGGRLECQPNRKSCYLYLSALGIDRQPLPDLASTPRWLARLRATISNFALSLRSLLSADGP